MFVSDNHFRNQKSSEGSILLIVLIIVIVMGVFVGVMTQKINTIVKNQASIEQKKTTLNWARAISERIDCGRTLRPFNATSRCPLQTRRRLFFLNEAPLSATGPQSSYPIGKNWFAQVTCGNSDLMIKIAHYENGRFDDDPLTGQTLNFSHKSSLVSDGGYEIPMCPSYFGSDQPSVRILGMTKATQQKLLVEYNLSPTTGMIQFISQECDGRIGMVAQMDENPLPAIYGTGGVRTSYAKWFYDTWRASFNAWGQMGNMQPDWIFASPRYIGPHLRGSCVQICMMHGMSTGILTKCDGAASGSYPPLGRTVWDDPSPQVNCLCIR